MKTYQPVLQRAWPVLIGLLTFAGSMTVQVSKAAIRPAGVYVAQERSFDDLSSDEKKEFGKRIGPLIALIVLALFLPILLITLLRSGRYFRRHSGIGRKGEPTDLADAWSNYRLKDEDIPGSSDISPEQEP